MTMKLFFALSTVALASTVAFAQPSTSADETEIRRVNQEFFQALKKFDVSALDKLLSEDVVFSNGGKYNINKKLWLSVISKINQAESPSFKPIANTNIFRVTLHGNSAVVVGRTWTPTAKKGGQKMIYTQIFTKQDGKWRIAELISLPEN